MATVLREAAAAAVNKGPPSSFYESSRRKHNPVFQALEQEIKSYNSYMKKRCSPGFKPQPDDAASRSADTLFDLWNKYEPRLPALFYEEKLLEMGDNLVSLKEYNLALWQCYGRYIKRFGDVEVEEIDDVDVFKKTFFPNGFEMENAGLTFRALMGKCICQYQVIRLSDPKLQNQESIDKSIQLLSFLRLVTQVVLPQEKLCWLVFNGTIHIYSVSRHLMSLGYSSKVLEYLLWACMCMETSIPLLSVRYLQWRSTLYTAVCQCYYDCKQGHHAEAFARRGLTKINDLSQLENISNSEENIMTELNFRHATVKMAVMMFKRSAFETRKKPKGLLRPKQRANLKDAQGLPWPRTSSEKLLVEMFEGSAAQFLCVIETLTDSNRRTLVTSPPAPDSEVEVLDVFAELFLAGQEILAGGGGNSQMTVVQRGNTVANNRLAGVVEGCSLIEMATNGEDGVPITAAVKLIKLAYCYEHWELYDVLIDPVLYQLKEIGDDRYGPEIKALELLIAMEKVNPNRKHKKVAQDDASTVKTEGKAEFNQGSPRMQSLPLGDDLQNLGDVLLSITNSPYSQDSIDMDMMMDAVLFLWNKCKAVFQKYQTGSIDNARFLQRMENPSKWVSILHTVHQVLGWCEMNIVDPALTAEVALRLALVVETAAADKAKSEKRKKKIETETDEGDGVRDTAASLSAQNINVSILNHSELELLVEAHSILELGLYYVSVAREAVALTDGKSLADVEWAKEINEDLFKPLIEENGDEMNFAATENNLDIAAEKAKMMKSDATAVWNTVKDLHLELIFIYHRVCLKLCILEEESSVKSKKRKSQITRMITTMQNLSRSQPVMMKNVHSSFHNNFIKLYLRSQNVSSGHLYAYLHLFGKEHSISTFEQLVGSCNKSLISKALLYMQKALMLGSDKNPTKEQTKLLEDALSLILKTEIVEKNLYIESMINQNKNVKADAKIPPAPILLARTDTTMIFKPAEFHPANEKVAWYRIFGRSAQGSNIKVRLNDYYLPGTGQQVPSFSCELRVSGLQPGERYVFAVAAYTAAGKLIGDCIGQTSKSILASHPLPVLMTWAYLSQVAYQVGCFNIALKACDVLWGHFIAVPPPPNADVTIMSKDIDAKLTLHKLNKRVVSLASPVLLRQFLTSIFINVDVHVRQGQLYCDILCDQGPLHRGQMARLVECERMLAAVELAGWLNETNLALQAVLQCYGLVAPLIQFKISSIALVQILERCLAVMLEIPAALRLKRQQAISDSLHHMSACMSYHLAKVLRTWGQRQLANHVNDSARRLLSSEVLEVQKPSQSKAQPPQTDIVSIPAINQFRNIGKKVSSMGAVILAKTLAHRYKLRATDVLVHYPSEEDDNETVDEEKTTTDTGSLTLAALKKRKGKNKIFGGKDDQDESTNVELKALEAHMLRLSKQAQSDHELIGNEDPSILYAYIAYLPSRIAYKEVVKFKRRARYIEFFVQVIVKALAEGLAVNALEWCEDTAHWLNKRNEQILGPRVILNKQAGAITVGPEDSKKTYSVTVVEFTKDKADLLPKPKPSQSKIKSKKQNKVDPQIKPNNSRTLAKRTRKKEYVALWKQVTGKSDPSPEQEEVILRAMGLLANVLPDVVRNFLRHRKLRKVCTDEMPWRAQLNNFQGLSQFSVFMHKLELMEKMSGNVNSNGYRSSFLDLEWFTLETTGTLIVGWDGGPSRQATRTDVRVEQSLSSPKKSKKGSNGKLSDGPSKMSGLERAAAAATGIIPPPAFPVIEEEPDTPRTYRSDETVSIPRSRKTDPKVDPEALMILTPKSAEQMLKKTFILFQKAIVLAHRGQHWTLLQNACRGLWNCAHNALLRTAKSSQNPTGLLTFETLRAIVIQPFSTAADCLLDMLVILQDSRELEAWKKSKSDNAMEISWMGDIADEKGGASLKFESPLDDISIVDTRWVRRIVLRVLELLYFERKWERLVNVALRFNAITNDRYAVQVSPLLIQAQHKLIAQVESYDGETPPQAQFKMATQQINGPVTSKNFQDIQLQVFVALDKLSHSLDPGAQLDIENADLYGGGVSALKNISVPLDIPQSLNELHMALEKSQYTGRALFHSRKLLALYLAGQQNDSNDFDLNFDPSRVDFAMPVTAKPQLTMPPDLTIEDFHKMDDVQNAPLPRTQMGVVVASYNKTIELLMAKNQRSLAGQAMHELANLYYHAGNIKAAYKWWSDSLDVVMNMSDVLHKWRQLAAEDKEDNISKMFQDRCGLWGCLLSGVIASKIAQYVLTSDLGLRLETCFLSGYCFKALFCSSLPHPIADSDYALYDIGEGCEVTNLVPGIDLFSDRFRCEGRTVVAALRWVTEELARGRHNLFVLPLLSLNQYFATFVCRDVHRCVDGRILKVRVLTDLALFTEAFVTLMRLLHGERLPQTVDSNFRQMESKMGHQHFTTSKPILEHKNLQILENVIDKRLSSNLGALYGPHLTCGLSIVQAHLLISLADTIPVIPDFSNVVVPSGPSVKGTSVSMDSLGVRIGSKRSKPATITSHKPRHKGQDDLSLAVKDDSDSDGESKDDGPEKRFSPRDKEVTLAYVKGTLLAAGDKIISTIDEIIIENAENGSGTEFIQAAELELVVSCKLELSNIARQRHHSSMAARSVLAAMKLLQNSEVFKEKVDQPNSENLLKNSSIKGSRMEKTSRVQIKEVENSVFRFANFQSRSRLDARLWLDCRLALVKSMMCELKGMGEIKGTDRSVKVELADCRLYCAEGVAEAEAVGDAEILAEFLMQGALLDIMEGKPVENTKLILQDVMEMLTNVAHISPAGKLLHVTAMVQLIDLVAAGKSSSHQPITEKTLLDYLNAQQLLLDQFQMLGEKVEHHNPIGKDIRSHRDGPVSPLLNIYLPHLTLLVQIKLRIGHAMARNVTRTAKTCGEEQAIKKWSEVLSVLMLALELNKISLRRLTHVEAEILLNMGKVQRQLCLLGQYQHRAVAKTLIEAIKISHQSTHDLGLIRQSYLEIAMVYLTATGSQIRDGSPTGEPSGLDSESDGGAQSPVMKRRHKKSVHKKGKTKLREESEGEKDKRAAWLSIRCAAAVGQAMRAVSLLAGDNSVTSVTISDKSRIEMPEFAVLDLISSYVLGEKKKVFKNDIEEELSNMPVFQEPKVEESYDEQVRRACESATDISWVHLLGYQSLLLRICSTGTISITQSDAEEVRKDYCHDELIKKFDLGFVSHVDTDYFLNQDVVRYTLDSNPWAVRVAELHQYFLKNLPVYQANCAATYPPTALELQLPENVENTPLSIFTRTYHGNMILPPVPQPDGTIPSEPLPPGSIVNSYKPDDSHLTTATGNELVIQCYQPAMQELEMYNTELSRIEKRIILMYTINKKKERSSSNISPLSALNCNMMWLSLNQLLELHDRLTLLAQRGEISLTDPQRPKQRKESMATTSPPKPKKAHRIKALSAMEKKDEHLDQLLRQCLSDIQTLFGVVLEKSEHETEADQTSLCALQTDEGLAPMSFEVTRTNVSNIEKLFNPNYGFILKDRDMFNWFSKLFSTV